MNKPIFKTKILNKTNCNFKKDHIPSDISGSYTGRPLNEDHPTQDADDL